MIKNSKRYNWFTPKKTLAGVSLLFLSVIVVNVIDTGSKIEPPRKADTSSLRSSSPDTDPTLTSLHVPARDGVFEFTIDAIDCGRTTVGQYQQILKTAQGKFCLVTIRVKNIDSQQHIFDEGYQKLLNAAGQQYLPDIAATLDNSSNSDALVAQINPGNTAQGILVYDIPTDQTPTNAELHDSFDSHGVIISLQ